MANRYWFKPKTYGYGFVPVTWEGWLATLALVGLILWSMWLHEIVMDHPSTKNVLGFLLDIALITVCATLLFEKKMQEPLKWRWGQ